MLTFESGACSIFLEPCIGLNIHESEQRDSEWEPGNVCMQMFHSGP